MLGLARGCEILDPPVSGDEIECVHVRAEASLDVMVLAVHVCGDCTADSDHPSTGSHWHEIASRHQSFQQGINADSGTCSGRAMHCVEINGVEGTHVEHGATTGLRCIAVRTPETARKNPAFTGLGDEIAQFVDGARLDDMRHTRCRATPAGQQSLVVIALQRVHGCCGLLHRLARHLRPPARRGRRG